jgi:hypothetical protein
MASIDSKEAVDKIITTNGADGCIKIVQYNNMFDGRLAYGLVFKGDGKANYNRYEKSAACRNPVVLWEKQ